MDPGRRARPQTRSAADEFYCLKSFKLLCPRSLSWPLSGYSPADGAGLTMNTADWWSCASDIVCGLDLRAKDRVSVRSPGPATAHAISLTNTLDLFSPDVHRRSLSRSCKICASAPGPLPHETQCLAHHSFPGLELSWPGPCGMMSILRRGPHQGYPAPHCPRAAVPAPKPGRPRTNFTA